MTHLASNSTHNFENDPTQILETVILFVKQFSDMDSCPVVICTLLTISSNLLSQL